MVYEICKSQKSMELNVGEINVKTVKHELVGVHTLTSEKWNICKSSVKVYKTPV